ncbi:MAG: flavin reductase family protein [Synergistaceae bacterium]|jgi:flavin reductase (DIM6/NTAB) family NADH-FMN oxidoreductase RutF|nr:flavin reductase family protein [Synergistaceae bacterium]
MTGKKNIGASVALCPTPLALCGTYDAGGKPNLATLAWVGVCCSTPPAVQISLQRPRYTYEAILDKREFTVNIPSEKQAKAADFCGLVSGRSVDKFASAGLTQRRGEFVNAPVVNEFPICMECRVINVLELGSHVLFVGEILASWVSEDCLGSGGNADPSLVAPLLYSPIGHSYYGMGSRVGGAFDIGKTLIEGEK